MKRVALLATVALASLGLAVPACAGETVQLLFQSRTDRPAGTEVYLAQFASLNSFLASGSSGEGGQFIGLNVTSDYEIAGFDIYNGRPYLLFQSRVDRPGGTEVFIAPFDSLDSFLASGISGEGGQFIGLNVTSDYKIAGFDIYDDKPYLLFQSRVDRPGGTEVFIAPFDSLDSFMATGAFGEGGQFIGLNVTSDYEIAGFDIFNDKPYLLFESRSDRAAGTEVFIAPFASLDSFMATGVFGEGGQFIGLNVTSDYRIAGFDILPDRVSGAVPEPAAWALMIGGFGMAGAALRRRRLVID